MIGQLKIGIASLSLIVASLGTISFNPGLVTAFLSQNSEVLEENVSIPSYEQELKDWILELVQKESGGREDIKHLDVNGKYSYSCLQFQEETFVGFVKEFNLLPGAEDDEILNFIMDCEIAKQLAFLMISDRYDNWKHWRNSVLNTDLGLPPQKVDDITSTKSIQNDG